MLARAGSASGDLLPGEEPGMESGRIPSIHPGFAPGQRGHDLVHGSGGHAVELFGASVLNRMRHPHDPGLESERWHLMGRRIAKGGGGDEDPGDSEIVQGLDVMQTA